MSWPSLNENIKQFLHKPKLEVNKFINEESPG